jgi:hypothetical protein
MKNLSLTILLAITAAGCGDDDRAGDDRTGADLGSAIACEVIPCRDLAPDSCAQVGGCRFGGSCEGTPTRCSALAGFRCDRQAGCVWDGSTATCSGTAMICEITTDQIDCEGRGGCTWAPACDGSPLSVETEICQDLSDRETCDAYRQCRLAE